MSNMQISCPRGHLYDSSLPSCPYCPPSAGQNIGATAPLINPSPGNIGVTVPVNPPQGNIGVTVPIDNSMKMTEVAPELQNATGVVEPPNRVRPVVGWLVCVQGPDIGKDFRLHAHFNSVGRGSNQDVRINDKFVSKEEHFSVAYDLVNNRFFAEKGRGKSYAYVNGYSLGSRIQLKKGDQIKVGETLLVFIPLEQQDVKWNWKI